MGRLRIATALGLVAIVSLISSCGPATRTVSQDSRTESTVGAETSPSRVPPTIPEEVRAELPEATTYATLPSAPLDPRPHDETKGMVIHPRQELVIYDSVGGEPFAVLPVEQINSPTWVPVIAREGEWAHILLPTRPNGASGWIYTWDDRVKAAYNGYSVKVDLSEFSLTIRYEGERVGRFTIGIGKPQHPTPTGRAYIVASIKEQVNDYSPIILPLSVHSNTHKTYGGGPGTVGIHTWPNNSFLGKATSAGCIRVTGQALEELVKLPLGTIVDIVQ